LNLLGTYWGGNPSDDDGVAGVPCLEDGEWDIWLSALACKEIGLGSEGDRTELQKQMSVSKQRSGGSYRRVRTASGLVVPLSIRVLTESDWSV
jgi:hypothetical protein